MNHRALGRGVAAALSPLLSLSAAHAQNAQKSPAAAAGPRYIAAVSANGTITLRRADNDAPFATVRPALYETGWQGRGLGVGGAKLSDAPGGAGTRTVGRIAATSAGSSVAVTGEQRAIGSRLTVRYTMTADKATPVSSAHVSLDVPAARWLGATARVGGAAPVSVPTAAGAVRLAEDAKPSVTLESPSAKLVVAAQGTTTGALLQDNRSFGSDALELRFSARGLANDALPAGRPVVFALTLDLPGTVTLEKQTPVTLAAGPDWVPLDQKLDIAPNSALDFSFLNRDAAPAGKWGRVIVGADGRFAYEKKKDPVRFWGANLCFSANYLSHDESDRLADRFLRLGYNTVRIHHYEGELVDTSKPDTLTLRPDSLDKLDYLVAAMKKRGIYTTTDLYVSRPVKEGETAEGATGDDFKAAVYVSDSAFENWKAFSRALLTHVNPYTGLAWKDEPAVAWIACINEPNLTNKLGRFAPKVKALYDARWGAWLRARYADDAALHAAWTDHAATLDSPALPGSIEDNERGRDVAAFLATVHRDGYAKMAGFLKNEIGTRALLTDMNGWSETPAFMAARADFDFVDNHFYWDHPVFVEKDWQLPSQGNGRSAVEAGGGGPSSLSMTRLFGKPFTVTEFNYSGPNRFRAEGGLLMGAASAIQDWDAVWRFAYSHSREAILNPGSAGYFDVVSDPANLASERVAVMLYRRRDLPAARYAVARTLSPDALLGANPPAADQGTPDLTLVTRVGTALPAPPLAVTGKGKKPAAEKPTTFPTLDALRAAGGLPPANRTNLTAGVRESEGGELLLDANAGTLRIATERTVGGVIPAGATLTAGPLTVRVEDARAVVYVTSLDGRPVNRSRRLLVAHLTDVQNSGMRYATPERTLLEAWGGLPHLARRGRASLTLRHPDGVAALGWRLDASGARTQPMLVKRSGDDLLMDLTTAGPDGKATLYYEVSFD